MNMFGTRYKALVDVPSEATAFPALIPRKSEKHVYKQFINAVYKTDLKTYFVKK